VQRIIPNVWFDHTAAEAADFYVSVFPDSRILQTQHYPSEELPDFQREWAGQVLAVEFEIAGTRFVAINAGPQFPVNPSISFMLVFDPSRDPAAREQLDAIWERLSDGGEALMPLGDYDFSPHYGWVRDRYGVSWQLILGDPDGDPRPFVVPSLLFGGPAQNRAGEALEFYQQVFPGSREGVVARYEEPVGPATRGALMFADLELLGQWVALMDSGVDQDYTFNPGISLAVHCADQAEIDHYWQQLSTVPEAEQCGWCVDRFGVSWQVLPANLSELTSRPGGYQRMLQMKKIDIAALS